jgi:cytochrome c-type biogenesis protein CcsB
VLGLAAFVAAPAARGADWRQWRSLPVLDRGRQKPLDTLARETLRTITGRSSVADPESGETLDATAAYLTMLFDWRADRPAPAAGMNPHGAGMSPHGAGKSPHGAGTGPHGSPGPAGMPGGAGMNPHGAGMSPHGMGGPAGMAGGGMSRSAYFRVHQADKWDQAPLILVESAELRAALDLAPGQRHISAWDLSQAEIEDPRSEKKTYFLVMMQMLSMRDENTPLSDFEKNVLETAGRLKTYQEHRMGLRLDIVPIPESEVRAWASIGSLTRVALDERTDPTGLLRQVKKEFEGVRAAYGEGTTDEFDAASADFLATLRELGPQLGDYPAADVIDLEVAYNHWPPFRIAWILSALAGLCAAVSLGVRTKLWSWLTLAGFVAALAAMLAGFVVRTIITAHPPLTNMYESVVFVAFAAVVMGLICQAIYRQPVIPLVTAAVATLMLIVADNGSGTLSPDMHPLKPILRSSFWLIVHVKVIMASYAAFALALGVGNVTLGYYLASSQDRSAIAALSKFTYRTLQVGVFLLAAGTITGALWADYAWGRFWGWDPKEVWALISLLAYTAVLHLRYAGWLGYRALAALSVLCFAFIIATWFFVNFLMSGLHSYGSSGSGAMPFILGGLSIQAVYVGIALLRSASGNATAAALSD